MWQLVLYGAKADTLTSPPVRRTRWRPCKHTRTSERRKDRVLYAEKSPCRLSTFRQCLPESGALFHYALTVVRPVFIASDHFAESFGLFFIRPFPSIHFVADYSKAYRTLRTRDTSDPVSRQFGPGTKVSGHFGPTFLGPKCLGYHSKLLYRDRAY